MEVWKYVQDFDKKIGSGRNVNEVLDQELHKPSIKKFKKGDARFKYDIWAADIAKMGSLSPRNGGVKYWLYVVDVFTKYTWAKRLKDRKAQTVVLNGFIEILNESKRKPNKSRLIKQDNFTITLSK